MDRYASKVICMLFFAGCASNPKPFVTELERDTYSGAMQATRKAAMADTAWLRSTGLGTLYSVGQRSRPLMARAVARGRSAAAALAVASSPNATEEICESFTEQLLVFVTDRGSGAPMSLVSCASLHEQISRERAVQAQLVAIATEHSRLRANIDTLQRKTVVAERLLGAIAAVDLIQQNQLAVRGRSLDSLQQRTAELSVVLRRLSSGNKTLADSVAARWRAIEVRLGAIQAALGGAR